MASKSIFKSRRGGRVPAATTRNRAGGLSYQMTPEMGLAQMAFTGTFNDSFYVPGTDQLTMLQDLAEKCDPEFIGKCAVAAREQGYMKDMPAALCVILSMRDPKILRKVFPRAINNGKQIRNFVQMIRSGVFGRKSLGTGPKNLVKTWLDSRSDLALFRDSVGKDPSLADIIKMVHPRPKTEQRRALYAYLIDRDYEFESLPEVVQEFELWKKGNGAGEPPNVDFRQLTALPLTAKQWGIIARRGGWHQTRMNLNTYARQGVFEIDGMSELIAEKLVDRSSIKNSMVFPYQLLAAYINTGKGRTSFWNRRAVSSDIEVPDEVRLALQDALEIAVENVPAFPGRVAILVDTSGSMRSPVTGYRKGASTKVQCVDVAALIAATVLRKNPLAVVVPVDTRVHSTDMINPKDSVMTNADRLADLGGGGTDLGAGMRFIATAKKAPDLIWIVSDNESWRDSYARWYRYGTQTMEIYKQLKRRNPDLKMVNLDIQANTSSQTSKDSSDILMLGGFSDQTFLEVDRFVRGEGAADWVESIKSIDL